LERGTIGLVVWKIGCDSQSLLKFAAKSLILAVGLWEVMCRSRSTVYPLLQDPTEPRAKNRGVEVFHSGNWTTLATQETTFCPQTHHINFA
jgi:hypothetical protein